MKPLTIGKVALLRTGRADCGTAAKRGRVSTIGLSTVPGASATGLSKGEPYSADLVVIGGGSAGFAAAIRGHELGARVIMVNSGTIGGTCVNVGCVPSKTLLRAAENHHRVSQNRFAGIQGSSGVTDFSAVIRQKDELVSSLRQAKYVDVLAAYDKFQLIEGPASFRSDETIRVNGRDLRALRSWPGGDRCPPGKGWAHRGRRKPPEFDHRHLCGRGCDRRAGLRLHGSL